MLNLKFLNSSQIYAPTSIIIIFLKAFVNHSHSLIHRSRNQFLDSHQGSEVQRGHLVIIDSHSVLLHAAQSIVDGHTHSAVSFMPQH